MYKKIINNIGSEVIGIKQTVLFFARQKIDKYWFGMKDQHPKYRVLPLLGLVIRFRLGRKCHSSVFVAPVGKKLAHVSTGIILILKWLYLKPGVILLTFIMGIYSVLR